jgi:hypothetical protein
MMRGRCEPKLPLHIFKLTFVQTEMKYPINLLACINIFILIMKSWSRFFYANLSPVDAGKEFSAFLLWGASFLFLKHNCITDSRQCNISKSTYCVRIPFLPDTETVSCKNLQKSPIFHVWCLYVCVWEWVERSVPNALRENSNRCCQLHQHFLTSSIFFYIFWLYFSCSSCVEKLGFYVSRKYVTFLRVSYITLFCVELFLQNG